MLSKGKKIDYRCPTCGSPSIELPYMFRQRSYSCKACSTFGPWRKRKKVKVTWKQD